jgi:hypothetical protein
MIFSRGIVALCYKPKIIQTCFFRQKFREIATVIFEELLDFVCFNESEVVMMKTYLFLMPVTFCALLAPAAAQIPTLTMQEVQQRRQSEAAVTDKRESSVSENGRVLVIHQTQPAMPSSSPISASGPARETRSPQPGNRMMSDAQLSQRAFLSQRLQAIREKIRDLFRRSDQAELESNNVRNRLFSAQTRDPEENGKLLQRIGELRRLSQQLRAQAWAARDEEADLAAQLEDLGFDPNAELTDNSHLTPAQQYRLRFDRLQADIQDTRARRSIVQLHINEIINQVRRQVGNFDPVTGLASGGDNFYRNRLRQQLQEEQDYLRSLDARVAFLNARLNELLEDARRADIAPGTFR